MKRSLHLLGFVGSLIGQQVTGGETPGSVRRVEEETKKWFELDASQMRGWLPWRRNPKYRMPHGEIVGGMDGKRTLSEFHAGAISVVEPLKSKRSLASVGEFPWFVSLEYTGRFYCGGSLIAPNKVLSAAHCFFDNVGGVFLPSRVRIGHTSRADGQVADVSCVTIHPDYSMDFQGLYNDVAVLTLSEEVTVSSYVTLNEDASYPSTRGQSLTAIGFGRTSGGGSASATLKKAGCQ